MLIDRRDTLILITKYIFSLTEQNYTIRVVVCGEEYGEYFAIKAFVDSASKYLNCEKLKYDILLSGILKKISKINKLVVHPISKHKFTNICINLVSRN